MSSAVFPRIPSPGSLVHTNLFVSKKAQQRNLFLYTYCSWLDLKEATLPPLYERLSTRAIYLCTLQKSALLELLLSGACLLQEPLYLCIFLSAIQKLVQDLVCFLKASRHPAKDQQLFLSHKICSYIPICIFSSLFSLYSSLHIARQLYQQKLMKNHKKPYNRGTRKA